MNLDDTPDLDSLRWMEIPENDSGMAAGTWLRWGELRLFLLDKDERELADEIESIMRLPVTERRTVTVEVVK